MDDRHFEPVSLPDEIAPVGEPLLEEFRSHEHGSGRQRTLGCCPQNRGQARPTSELAEQRYAAYRCSSAPRTAFKLSKIARAKSRTNYRKCFLARSHEVSIGKKTL